MRVGWRTLVAPERPAAVGVVTDPVERRAIVVELVLVGILTFGFSALSAILSLIELQLTGGVSNSTVALNPKQSPVPAIDALRQVMGAVRLFAIAGLGAYLLWRSGLSWRVVGLARPRVRADLPAGAGLALLIGLPGLALIAIARVLGLNAHLVPAESSGIWWRWPLLIAIAVGNAAAEEIVVVVFVITRLRQLGWSENRSLLVSSVLRGGYHLYQGIGAGIGNVAMGLVFGRWFQVTNRAWPLVVAHALIDIVAFVGYAVLRGHLGWVG